MVIEPEIMTRVQDLVQKISDSSRAYLEQDESARASIIALARSLISELETPNDTIAWLAVGEPTRRAAISTAIQLNVFPLLSVPKTVLEVATSCDVFLLLVKRLLRHLAAIFVIIEVGHESFSSTALSRALCDPKHCAALAFNARLTGPVLTRLPAYLASTNYQDPWGQGVTPFQFAFETKMSPWAWASTKPEIAQAFVQYMSGYHTGRPSWMDPGFYPLEEKLLSGYRNGTEKVLLVDIGDGLGYDLDEFRQKCATMIEGRRLVL